MLVRCQWKTRFFVLSQDWQVRFLSLTTFFKTFIIVIVIDLQDFCIYSIPNSFFNIFKIFLLLHGSWLAYCWYIKNPVHVQLNSLLYFYSAIEVLQEYLFFIIISHVYKSFRSYYNNYYYYCNYRLTTFLNFEFAPSLIHLSMSSRYFY